MKWAIALGVVALAGCEADNINARGRVEQSTYLMKACVEKGGFPSMDLGGNFKECHWPPKK